MTRKIIKIDENKCNGCGECVEACHEGAIAMINDKAKLTREDYCDGLGDCLPACPVGAIAFEEREALPYDEKAVIKEKESKNSYCLCPGMQSRRLMKNDINVKQAILDIQSELMQWPVQIKLVPVNAPYFENANLLVAADCSAFAYGTFHNDFMKKHITIIGCPKLDNVDYSNKLTEIIKNNNIKSVKVVRMEVPCCGGIEQAVKRALINSGKMIPWKVITISTGGKIID